MSFESLFERPDLPNPLQLGEIDRSACDEFMAQGSKRLAVTANQAMCDSNVGLSDLADEVLVLASNVVDISPGQSFVSVAGYNLEEADRGDTNPFHSDRCQEVLIASMGGEAELHAGWIPVTDSRGRSLRAEPNLATRGAVSVFVNDGSSDYKGDVEVQVIDCVAGTIVKIDESQGSYVDQQGVAWEFRHGVYNTRGPRLSLQYRQLDERRTSQSIQIGRVPRSAVGPLSRN